MYIHTSGLLINSLLYPTNLWIRCGNLQKDSQVPLTILTTKFWVFVSNQGLPIDDRTKTSISSNYTKKLSLFVAVRLLQLENIFCLFGDTNFNARPSAV